MDLRRIFISPLMLLFLGFFLFFPPPLQGQNVSDIVGDSFEELQGRGLVIRTKPIGARVFIDGLERGQSPLTINNLPGGEYNVRLVKEGFRERRFKITLSSASRMVISIEMEEAVGQVLFNLRKSEGSPPEEVLPFQPVITVGGETFTGPAAELPVGYRTIRVRSFGWEDLSETVYVREGMVHIVDFTLRPAAFQISRGAVSRPRFNPANSGALGLTEFRFEVSAPGRGTITVKDSEGRIVYEAGLGLFREWSQGAVWRGRGAGGEPLPGGIYKVFIEAESLPWDGSAPVSQSLSLEAEIDPSVNIYPLSLSGGISGLLFAPVPAALPRGSFQIGADMFFGKTSPAEEAFSGLPFGAGIRFSPLDRLEINVVLNALPKFGDTAVWGFSGSGKWVFLRGEYGLPLSFAAGLSYVWEEEGGAAPLSPAGISLYLPLAWRLKPVSLLFSPGLRVPVPDDPVPRLFLSGGVLFQGNWFTAGFSLRPEFNFSTVPEAGPGKDAGPVLLFTAGELKFYPPPSNLVFTLSGGVCMDNSGLGGFGGVGIGIIY